MFESKEAIAEFEKSTGIIVLKHHQVRIDFSYDTTFHDNCEILTFNSLFTKQDYDDLYYIEDKNLSFDDIIFKTENDIEKYSFPPCNNYNESSSEVKERVKKYFTYLNTYYMNKLLLYYYSENYITNPKAYLFKITGMCFDINCDVYAVGKRKTSFKDEQELQEFVTWCKEQNIHV